MDDDRNIKEVVRIESMGVNTFIYFADGYAEQVAQSIDEMELEFLSSGQFVRIHPRHLINSSYYKKVSNIQQPFVEMTDGMMLPTDSRLINVEDLFPERRKIFWRRITRFFKQS